MHKVPFLLSRTFSIASSFPIHSLSLIEASAVFLEVNVKINAKWHITTVFIIYFFLGNIYRRSRSTESTLGVGKGAYLFFSAFFRPIITRKKNECVIDLAFLTEYAQLFKNYLHDQITIFINGTKREIPSGQGPIMPDRVAARSFNSREL